MCFSWCSHTIPRHAKRSWHYSRAMAELPSGLPTKAGWSWVSAGREDLRRIPSCWKPVETKNCCLQYETEHRGSSPFRLLFRISSSWPYSQLAKHFLFPKLPCDLMDKKTVHSFCPSFRLSTWLRTDCWKGRSTNSSGAVRTDPAFCGFLGEDFSVDRLEL